MFILKWLVYAAIKTGLWIACRIDAPGLNNFPRQGPLILYTNHTGAIEVPVLYGLLYPRRMTGWGKVESWKKAYLYWLFLLWDAIPVRRGEADRTALKLALAALKKGFIFALAPEGTRNKTGQLIRARPGVVMLALFSGAPLIPIAHWGGEEFRPNLKRFSRTDIHLRVGQAFKINMNGTKATSALREEIVDDMMYKLAALLPEQYRGEYSDLEKSNGKYFEPVAEDLAK
jgi:1-acyl-sn-glycerol-3-phosphate acyltransferase